MKQKTAQETRHISIIGLVLIMLLPLLPTKAGNVVDEISLWPYVSANHRCCRTPTIRP